MPPGLRPPRHNYIQALLTSMLIIAGLPTHTVQIDYKILPNYCSRVYWLWKHNNVCQINSIRLRLIVATLEQIIS